VGGLNAEVSGLKPMWRVQHRCALLTLTTGSTAIEVGANKNEQTTKKKKTATTKQGQG